MPNSILWKIKYYERVLPSFIFTSLCCEIRDFVRKQICCQWTFYWCVQFQHSCNVWMKFENWHFLAMLIVTGLRLQFSSIQTFSGRHCGLSKCKLELSSVRITLVRPVNGPRFAYNVVVMSQKSRSCSCMSNWDLIRRWMFKKYLAQTWT